VIFIAAIRTSDFDCLQDARRPCPRPPGALQRIVRLIKADLGSDAALLRALGLTTPRPDYRLHTSPRPRLSLKRGGDSKIVIVHGKRWGHAGLLVESRRGTGDGEEISILGGRAFRDTRPSPSAASPKCANTGRGSWMGRRRSAAMGRRWRGVTVSGRRGIWDRLGCFVTRCCLPPIL